MTPEQIEFHRKRFEEYYRNLPSYKESEKAAMFQGYLMAIDSIEIELSEAMESQEPIYQKRHLDERWWEDTDKNNFDVCTSLRHIETRKVFLCPVPTNNPVNRQDIIDVLLSTRGQSEGVTADAILGLLSDNGAAVVPECSKRLYDHVCGYKSWSKFEHSVCSSSLNE